MALSEEHPLLVEALDVFDKEGLTYIPMLKGSMVWVDSKLGRRYAFYPTTGRWAPYGVRDKHYRSRGAQDFVDRFVNRSDRKKEEAEDTLKKVVPVGCNCSLEELLLYAFEQFENGKTPQKVFKAIKDDVWSLVCSTNDCSSEKG